MSLTDLFENMVVAGKNGVSQALVEVEGERQPVPPLCAVDVHRNQTAAVPCVWGYTLEGVYIIVVYDPIDEDTIRVVTAYEVPERG